MASNTAELLPILKALREYIVKEYGVNYPPHVRGEDASGKDLPSNWVDKLDPISGGDTVGRDSHGSQGTKSTKAGAQGTDPYIHKSELEAMLQDFAKHFVDGQPVQAGAPRDGGYHGSNGYGYPGDGERIPEGRGLGKDGHEEMSEDDDMMDDMVDDVEDEEIEDVEDDEMMDDDMEKNYMAAGGHMERSADGISELLKDIKGLLSSRHQEKQEYTAIQSEISDLKKSVNNQVRDGIKKGLKQFNLNPSRGDTMARMAEPTDDSILGIDREQPVEFPDQRIGVEGESFQKSSEEEGQEQFVDGIEQVVNRTDKNDLRGHFRMVNEMRNQTGELTPHTLYYYPNKGGR